jgi:hypothetical protein
VTITGANLRDETIVRIPFSGDNFHATWGADGRQYLALCDGGGASPFTTFYNSRLVAIDGDPANPEISDVPGYPLLEGIGKYYNFGTISVDGVIYQYLGSPKGWFTSGESDDFVGSKLIYSPDGGATWHNQDGSTPVVWEDEEHRTKDTMIFWEEDQTSFAVVTLAQHGQDNSAAPDGYVYGYAPNGGTEGTMNELVMFRVPKGSLRDRSAYEYFQARNDDGSATWTSDIRERGVVLTYPSGWVNSFMHPYAWMPSVTYNEALGEYLMASWATGVGDDQWWFRKPSYLGFWSAPTPWGPWTQFHEDTSWTPGGDENARCYSSVILPKWVSEDGRSFWLMWTDFQSAFSEEEKARRLPEIKAAQAAGDHVYVADYVRDGMPYYAINLQRVDLTVE